MKKKDLKTGMVVKWSDGHYGVVMSNEIVDTKDYAKISLERYDENLIYQGLSTGCYIKEVFKPHSMSYVVKYIAGDIVFNSAFKSIYNQQKESLEQVISDLRLQLNEAEEKLRRLQQ